MVSKVKTTATEETGLVVAQEAAVQATIADNSLMASYSIMKTIGRIEASHFYATISDLAIAKQFEEIKNNKEYKGLPYKDENGNLKNVSDLEEFCQVFLRKSYRRCAQLSQNLNLLGEELYQQAEQIGFTARDYQALKALPAEDQEIVKQAIETEDKEHVIDLLQEMAVKHKREKEALAKELEDVKLDLEASRDTATKKEAALTKAEFHLEQLKVRIKKMPPSELGEQIRKEVTQYAVIAEQSIKSLQHALQELSEHGYKHGINHSPFIAGIVGQVSLTLNTVKLEFKVDETVVDDNPVPYWMRPEAQAEADAAIAALPKIGEESDE